MINDREDGAKFGPQDNGMANDTRYCLLFQALEACACGNGACASACAASVCATPPVAADTDCTNCVEATDSPGPGCDTELTACEGDV